MKEFLINNWKLILEICCAVFALVFMCIRKRPVKVVDTLKEMVVCLLPYCIMQAEKSSLKGDEKKNVALNLLERLIRESGVILTDDLIKFAGEQIEVILSTPTKKGVVYEKTHVK